MANQNIGTIVRVWFIFQIFAIAYLYVLKKKEEGPYVAVERI